MTKKSKTKVIPLTEEEKAAGGYVYEFVGAEGWDKEYVPTDSFLPIEPVILQEPKVTDVARLRAQKALEANVKRGKK